MTSVRRQSELARNEGYMKKNFTISSTSGKWCDFMLHKLKIRSNYSTLNKHYETTLEQRAT